MKRLFLLALLFPVIALAQVQKCQIDGKTVYSDSLCGQDGQAIGGTVNSLDMSGMRELAAKRDEKAAEVAAKEKADKPKRPSGRVGPCYSFEGSAYSDCMKRGLDEARRKR